MTIGIVKDLIYKTTLMMKQYNYLDIAFAYHSAGLKVMPVNSDKTPHYNCKSQFAGHIPYDIEILDEHIEKMFEKDCSAMALLCGNGIECIDIDSKNYHGEGNLVQKYLAEIESYPNGKSILERCVVQTTPSGGAHIIYRTDNDFISNSKKLCSEEYLREDGTIGSRVLIETRGKKGYCLVYPSQGYTMVHGEFMDVQEITVEERNVLFTAAYVFQHSIQEKVNTKRHSTPDYNTEKLYDIYNKETDIVSYLESKGWTITSEDSQRIYMKRPDDGVPTKAKNSGNYHKGLNLFIAHTTSTILEANKGYTAFGLLLAYEYSNDVKKALLVLKEKYNLGGVLEVKKETPKIDFELPKILKDVDIYEAQLVDWNAKHENYDYKIFIEHAKTNYKHGIGIQGSLGVFTGEAKSRKTSVAYSTMLSAATGNNHGGFICSIPKDKYILLIDTEQPFKVLQNRTLKLKPLLNGEHERIIPLSVANLSRAKRKLVIHNIVEKLGEQIGYILLDGYVDLMDDYNDLKEAQTLIEQVNQWRIATQSLFVTIIHLNSRDKKMRGHAGTELNNKADFGIETVLDKEIDSVTNVYSKFARLSSKFPSFAVFENNGTLSLTDNYSIENFQL